MPTFRIHRVLAAAFLVAAAAHAQEPAPAPSPTPTTGAGSASEPAAKGADFQKPDEAPRNLDIVRLVNGHEFIGRVTKETASHITIVFRGGEIELPKRRVAEIVRAERREVEAEAEASESISLGRYEERKESFYVYYRGKRVGWRETSLSRSQKDGRPGYLFSERTVYLQSDGKVDLDLRIDEFTSPELEPLAVTVSEIGPQHSHLLQGRIEKGHLVLRSNETSPETVSEILFGDATELALPLVRRLADVTHFPDRGESMKVFDSVRRRFVRIHATRGLRKEIVGGKHQFVTVWRLDEGGRAREVWIDGWGGTVREELGSPNMIALRADAEKVAAYARGEPVDDDVVDLSLDYENVPGGFKLARPNLSWSFELPDEDGPVAVSLVNPNLQASVDVVVLGGIDAGTEPETVVMELIERMKETCTNFEVLYQRAESIGGAEGVRFEVKADRKGMDLRTIGAVAVSRDKAFALMLAAPTTRFDEAKEPLERILKSFEAKELPKVAAQ